VTAARSGFDPYLHDPEHWGVSLAQLSELLLPCLDAAGARRVAEVGAFAGDLTRVLVDWAAAREAEVLAIDPAPQPALVALADTYAGLELIRQTSLDALPRIPLPDAIVIDGDHNYHTVGAELALIAERAGGAELPLLLLHDVCWPHARRDDYFDASLIPEARRHPQAGERGGLVPGDPGLRPGGLPYPRSAAREGGPGNGVLTAVEEFVAGHERLRLAVVPAFFGFGVAWDASSPYAGELARLLDPYDRNPILERLEANRVEQLARRHVHATELWQARERLARQEALLRRMLESSAFAVAERLSRLRAAAGVAPSATVISRDEISRVLGD
jgi:Methyltransferase domain